MGHKNRFLSNSKASQTIFEGPTSRSSSREVWRHARGREHCRGEPGSALLGGYAPDLARTEGSSIVDEPGKC